MVNEVTDNLAMTVKSIFECSGPLCCNVTDSTGAEHFFFFFFFHDFMVRLAMKYPIAFDATKIQPASLHCMHDP